MVRPYPETRVSTNLLAGDDDRLVSPARRSFRLQRALPLAALTRAPEGGHELHRTQT
jgi:alpha-beta hydrolase superfamily lysophospholipase